METIILITSYLDDVFSDDRSNESDCYGKPTFTHILIASSLGLIIAAVVYYHQRKVKYQKLVPKIKVDSSGRVVKLERFSHYVGN